VLHEAGYSWQNSRSWGTTGSAQRLARGLENDSIVLKIEDTGIGIAPAEQEFLFDRFRQGNHQRRGNGLGLYLSRQIVEAHHGSIRVESEVGHGSLFIVQFDLLQLKNRLSFN
jgi:signal transduction histidine kinase